MSREEPARIPNSPLLFVSVLFLALMGPVVSFARWHDWDAMRWMLKILSWLVTLGVLLYMRREPSLFRWLRFVPWMTLVVITFLSWIALTTGKITTEITVQIGWCLVVGGLFVILRRRYPGHFAATAYLDDEPQPTSPTQPQESGGRR